MMFEHRKSENYIYASALAKALILFTRLHKEECWNDTAVTLMIAVILFNQEKGEKDIILSSLKMILNDSFEELDEVLSESDKDSAVNIEYSLFLKSAVDYENAKSIYSYLQVQLIKYNIMEYFES